jgi:hypothetical protein
MNPPCSGSLSNSAQPGFSLSSFETYQYAWHCFETSVEAEEEEVKPNEWLMPQLSRFIAERARKPINSDTKNTDKSE